MKLLPSWHILCTSYNLAPRHLMQSHIRTMHAYLAVTSWLGSANVQFDAYSTWMTCDCSANKHWVHVYICTSEEWLLDWAVLTLQWLVTMQETMQYQQAVSISLSLSTDIYIYIHTHIHTPGKNLWLCSINKQWVHMYLRRMTCDCAVSTSNECTCT